MPLWTVFLLCGCERIPVQLSSARCCGYVYLWDVLLASLGGERSLARLEGGLFVPGSVGRSTLVRSISDSEDVSDIVFLGDWD